MKKIEFESIQSVSSLQDKVGNNINTKRPKPPFYTDKLGDTKIGDVWQKDNNLNEQTGEKK